MCEKLATLINEAQQTRYNEALMRRDEIFEEQLWLRERARRCHNGNA
jgi:hypothetical protein